MKDLASGILFHSNRPNGEDIQSGLSYAVNRDEQGLHGNVLFANDDKADSALILRLFPDRSLWVYERNPESLQGKLRLPD